MAAAALIIFSSALSGPRATGRPRMLAVQLQRQTMADVEECIVSSESASEADACFASDAIPKIPVSRGPAPPLSEMDSRAALMGPAASLGECFVDAENAGEIESCKSDYEALVAGPSAAPQAGFLTPAAVVLLLATGFAIKEYLLGGI